MRITWLMAVLSLAVLTTAGVALASHGAVVNPATVPTGLLAAHTRIAHVPLAPFVRAVVPDGAEVTIQHIRLAPGAATPWHTHPGPAIVTLVSGSLTYENAAHGRCRQVTYTADEGFVDPGFGHVHRVIAGSSGADLYVVYILPPGSGNPLIPAPAPAACA